MSNSSAAEVAAFKATTKMQERLKRFIACEHANETTAAEEVELDEYMRLKHFVVMLKTCNLRFVNGAREVKL